MEYNKNNDVDPNPLFDIFFFLVLNWSFFFKVPLLERKLYVAFLIQGWKKKKKKKKKKHLRRDSNPQSSARLYHRQVPPDHQ